MQLHPEQLRQKRRRYLHGLGLEYILQLQVSFVYRSRRALGLERKEVLDHDLLHGRRHETVVNQYDAGILPGEEGVYQTRCQSGRLGIGGTHEHLAQILHTGGKSLAHRIVYLLAYGEDPDLAATEPVHEFVGSLYNIHVERSAERIVGRHCQQGLGSVGIRGTTYPGECSHGSEFGIYFAEGLFVRTQALYRLLGLVELRGGDQLHRGSYLQGVPYGTYPVLCFSER